MGDSYSSLIVIVAKYCDEYVCVSVGLSVCLSVRKDISGTTRAIFTTFLVHVARVRGSDLRWHVYDRPHRPSPGRGFLHIEDALSAGKGGWECTARAKYAIYDCLVRRSVHVILTAAVFDCLNGVEYYI